MLNIRVWNLQSDRETEAVRFLENTFLRFRQLEYLAIRTTGKSALRKCHRQGVPVSNDLRKTLQHYLTQDNYIIFVVDPNEQRQQESKSLVDQLRQIIKDSDFADKVFFLPDLQEWSSSVPTQWQHVVSYFHSEVKDQRKRLQEKWDKTLAHFHEAFAGTPEEEVIRDFEEALAEVRRERHEHC